MAAISGSADSVRNSAQVDEVRAAIQDDDVLIDSLDSRQSLIQLDVRE